MATPQAVAWSPADAAMTAVMWVVMMAAMMLPSAVPMMRLFASVNRRRSTQETALFPTGAFLLGYVLIWSGFGLLATGVQWGLHTRFLLSPGLSITNPLVSGLVLLLAGIYQFTALKRACLNRCQSPLDFLFLHWREGARGAFAMGLRHGTYCLGCCWALMLLLFVGGIMNLRWIALIAAFVLLERVAVRGMAFGRAAGAGLILWGLGLAWQGVAP